MPVAGNTIAKSLNFVIDIIVPFKYVCANLLHMFCAHSGSRLILVVSKIVGQGVHYGELLRVMPNKHLRYFVVNANVLPQFCACSEMLSSDSILCHHLVALHRGDILRRYGMTLPYGVVTQCYLMSPTHGGIS